MQTIIAGLGDMLGSMRLSSQIVLLFVLFGVTCTATSTLAQGPDAEWKTLETENFRLHYTEPAEEWARRAAARLESIRQRVSHEVGYRLDAKVDVLITDPIARANGSAWPFQGWPRMVLYTTPPGPASAIGYYRDWGESLLVHEDTHLVHLLRPSRNPRSRFLSRFVPLGPIARRAPRWVSEGYATVLEGQLTGYGRPHSDLRATILRRWAQLGELPSYGRLNSDTQSWLGMSMAYLVGSAYLEWLVQRSGPDSLRQLWSRLTARQERSFEEAFTGVFGDAPHRLYNRFRAELTYRAMRLEEEREPQIEAGELWQDLNWTSGSPALAPDGEHLALVLRFREAPSRLVVWSTAEDSEAEAKRQENIEALLRRDPEDIAPVRWRPPPREALFELPTRNGAEPFSPRFTVDGRSVLFVRFEPDRQGFLAPDLFRWTLKTGAVDRLTWGAAVRDPDPSPEGTWAVAVRHRHGRSQLVAVDLVSGEVDPLTSNSLDTIWSHPRISPDGEHLAAVRHQNGSWRPVVFSLEGRQLRGEATELSAPPRATVSYPAWGAQGQDLFATLGERGFLDVHAWNLATGDRRVITRSHGAALAPAPGDGVLYFLGLEADGLDLRFLKMDSDHSLPTWTLAEGSSDLFPAVRPPEPPAAEPFGEALLPEPRPYGFGRLELLPLVGGIWGPGQQSWEAGVRLGDVVGRWNGLALVATGKEGPEGGALRLAWRGWPVELGLHLVAAEETWGEPSQSTERSRSRKLRGLEATARIERRRRNLLFTFDGGGYLGELETLATAEALRQESLFLDLGLASRQSVGPWRFDQSVTAGARLGRTEDDGWSHTAGSLQLGFGRKSGTRLGLAWHRRRAEGAQSPLDRLELGGIRGSLLPASVLSGRIHVPALEAGSLVGDESESQRLEARLGAWPVTVFYERHRLWNAGEPRAEWFALRGLEMRLARDPWPLLRLPAFELRLGAAEILDGTLRDRVEWWFGLQWEP